MATKYHVNVETGNLGICRAQIQCPLGTNGLHGDSMAEVAEKFEHYLTEEENNNGLESVSKAPRPADLNINDREEVVKLEAEIRQDRDYFDSYRFSSDRRLHRAAEERHTFAAAKLNAFHEYSAIMQDSPTVKEGVKRIKEALGENSPYANRARYAAEQDAAREYVQAAAPEELKDSGLTWATYMPVGMHEKFI